MCIRDSLCRHIKDPNTYGPCPKGLTNCEYSHNQKKFDRTGKPLKPRKGKSGGKGANGGKPKGGNKGKSGGKGRKAKGRGKGKGKGRKKRGKGKGKGKKRVGGQMVETDEHGYTYDEWEWYEGIVNNPNTEWVWDDFVKILM